MSTSATISTQIDGKIHGIYVHFDGYESGLGRTLEMNYKDYDYVVQLIKQGDASYISDTIEDSRFYHTWRGETLIISVANSLDIFIKEYGQEYNYYFDPDVGEWKIIKN